jgi:hypothetical protein
MDTKSALKSQYHAGMKVLKEVVERCPESTWNNPADGLRAIWRVVFHGLFVTDYYLQRDQSCFPKWAKYRDEAQCIGPVSWDNNREPRHCEPYSKVEVMEYWNDLDGRIDSLVDALDLELTESGFPWYKMSKFEHQLVNLRHLQHHAAALSVRLRESDGIQIKWVSAG